MTINGDKMETLPTPEYSKSFENFYSNKQIKKYAIQFMAIFSGMHVSSGKNDYKNPSNLIPVQIRYGHADRVVDSIKASNTTNKPVRLPVMAAYVSGLELNVESMKGMGQEFRQVFLPRGGVLPDDMKVIYRAVPVPIRITFELAIKTSNSHHLYEILEQILLLFDPTVQLQTSDQPYDWTKIYKVDLTDISFDNNYPSGQDQRIMGATLTFTCDGWISAPANLKDNVIKKIQIRIDAIHTYEDTQEVAEDVNRTFPEYMTLFDIEEYNIPKN